MSDEACMDEQVDAILSSGFSVLAEALSKAPMTWIPALLITCVEAGILRGVFVEGGASEMARRAEERLERRGTP